MKITLHPNIASLVKDEVERSRKVSKKVFHFNTEPTTPDEIVNEILWLALRSGDISKHYTAL